MKDDNFMDSQSKEKNELKELVTLLAELEDLGLAIDADTDETAGLLDQGSYQMALDRLFTAQTRAQDLAESINLIMDKLKDRANLINYQPQFLG
jgi:hypothetical protein